MESAQPAQEKLDEWLNSSPEDRERMRGGHLPAQVEKVFNGPGCGWMALTPLFGLGGGVLGMVTRETLGARLELTGDLHIALCAAVGMVVGYGYLKTRAVEQAATDARQIKAGPVRNEVLHLKSQPDGSSRVRVSLVASDGRSFTVMLAPPEFQIDGRYRVFYVDTATLKGKSGTAQGMLFALGLEVVEASSGW